MRCSACGTDNPSAAKFCNGCGAALEASCVHCGQGNPPASRFCNGCGGLLAEATRADLRDAESPSTAPSSYTPRHLAEKILSARVNLQGERKQVTVLFADVVGSTELIRDLDPEDGQRFLDGAVQVMMDAVHRYEGTVSRLMGDGLMAMFGAPVAHEDHAVRACYASLAMLEAIRGYAEEVRQAHGATIQIRFGLNSGEVIVRLISDDLHMDYTAMGPTVHLASRIEGLAAAGAVLLSPSTLALGEGLIEVRSLGPTPVRGLEQPLEVYELVGAGAARTRLQASAARGLTPFVGRQEERAAIDRALARARAGQGQVAALVAEAGVGKSRLVWELTHADQARGSNVLQAGALSYGQTTAWLPVIDVLRSYFQIEGRDDHAGMRDKVTAGVRALDPALEPGLPALLALLDLPVEDAAWAQLDPSLRRRATLDAVRQLLLRESQRQPLLLIFEDLHWIDSETQAMLDGLVESLPIARILLLVNYRPEYTHPWGNKSYYTQLRIDPLAEQSAEELLDALLGPDPSIRPLMALLVRRAEGTPLFLEESVRSLVETGALVGERGAYRLTRPVDDIRVPATVQAVLAARIDRLPAEEKRLLQTAAVIGKDVPYPLLRAIADLPDDRLQRGLVRLQAAEFLYEAALFPELGYTFKHALTHEVAYGSLLNERRRELHARIVDAVEQRYPERLAEQVDRLGHHALRGQLWEKAVTYLRRAGRREGARSANRQAATYFEQALEALNHLPNHRDARELAIDIRLDLRNVLLPLDEFASMFDHLQQAETLAVALDDHRRLGWVSAYLTACYCNAVKPREAEVAGLRAMTIADERADLPLQVMSHFFLGLAYAYACRFRESIGLLSWNVERLQGESIYERFGEPGLPAVHSRSYLVRGLAEVGNFEEGLARGDEAVRLSESTDLPFSLASSLEGLGYVHLRRGEIPQAITLLERGLQLCEQRQFHLIHYMIAAYLGYAYALAGRDVEAVPLLAESAAIDRGLHPALRVTMQGEAHLLAGRLDLARECVERAFALAAASEERGSRGWTLRLAAEIALDRGPESADQAATHYREALALAEELGMRPLQAHCHLGLWKLYRRVDRLDEARAELSTAIEMLRDMEMTHWLPEAEAELTSATPLL